MREIVDKHFPDNWIVPIYQGHIVDITEYWDSFPAAKKALGNNIIPENVREMVNKNVRMVDTSNKRL